MTSVSREWPSSRFFPPPLTQNITLLVTALWSTEATVSSEIGICLLSASFMQPIIHMKKENTSLNKFDP